jgi:hypothetical protein
VGTSSSRVSLKSAGHSSVVLNSSRTGMRSHEMRGVLRNRSAAADIRSTKTRDTNDVITSLDHKRPAVYSAGLLLFE